ncbi:MAG: AAA family ATPase, partial [Bradymonadia bacterium]
MTTPNQSPPQAFEHVQHLRQQLRAAVMGRDEVIDLLIIGLITGGHILLEDYPGSGKTTLAKALGHCIAPTSAVDGLKSFRRLQFTPDLLPSDITGVMIFDPNKGQFHLRKGPIFAHVVLVDEINRTSPKVQSALLESMAENQVTIDNDTYPLDPLFLVIATQNPSDSVGTYPLPQAQLDRFLFKVSMTHIDPESEFAVLEKYGQPHAEGRQHTPLTRDEILSIRTHIHERVILNDSIKHCLVEIANTSRAHPDVMLGLSTRTLVQAIAALKAHALLHQRDYVTPEDITALALPLFKHRLLVKGGEERRESIVSEIIAGPLDTLISNRLKG